MPDDNAPKNPIFGETPAENTPEVGTPTVDVTSPDEPAQEVIETPVVDPAIEAPRDGAVTPEELAAFSQTPSTPIATPPLDSTAPTTTSSPFGTPVLGSAPTPDLATPQKSPKKKKMIIVGAIIVGALAILGGGTAAAYNLWYQNPDKVVLEAVSSILQQGTSTHKVSVDITSKDVAIKLTVDAKVAQSPATEADIAATVTAEGKDYKVSGSTLTDKDGNLYFKLNDAKTLLAQLAGANADFSAFNDVIAKVDGQWIKVSSDDLKSVSEDYSKTQTCTTDALKKLDDKAVTKEITDLYQNNQFIVVGDKIGVKNINNVASLGYKVTLDEAKAKTFYTGLGGTSVGKALTACDSSFSFKASDLDTSSDSSQSTSEMQIWSSRFGHKLTELDLTGKSDDTTATIVWNPTFVKGVTVDAPSTSLSVKEIMTDIENDLSKSYGSAFSTDGSTDFSSDLSTDQNAFKLSSLL